MAFTPIEIIALFTVLFALVKISVILINPKQWMKFVRFIYGNTKATTVISLILAAIVLYFLLQELTIIHLFAVMLFLWLLMILGMAAYSKETIVWADKILSRKEIIKKSWFQMLLWLVLLLWALYVLFFNKVSI